MQLSAKVVKVLVAEKISPEELYQMLREAAFTSVRGCNLRHFQWLFVMKEERLVDMQRLEVVEVGRGHHRMLEDHEPCNGEGCKACGWVGQISRAVSDSTAAAMDAAT